MLTKICESLYVALHALRKNAEWQPCPSKLLYQALVSTIIIGDDSYLVLPDRQLFSYEQSAPADMGQEECHTHQPNPRDDADTLMDDSLTIIWGSQEDSDPRPALRRSNAKYFEKVWTQPTD